MRFLALLMLLSACNRGAAGPREPHDVVQAKSDAPVSFSSEEDTAIPISSDDPVWGARTAPITIVQFSDFECAHCAEMEVEIDELKQRLGREGLRVVFKHLPEAIHPNARSAAEAAQGVMALAGSQGFWTFHELAFTTEDELEQGRYEEWAALAGADVNALRAGLTAHTWAQKISTDVALAEKLGAKTPPAVFVNGTLLSEPEMRLTKLVEAEHVKAQQEIARGTPAERLYRVLVEANRHGPTASR